MPTLLEKPSSASPSAHHPVQVLHSRHRWERWRGVVTALLVGMAATLAALVALHPSWHTPADWKILAAVWTGGFLLTLIAAAVAWRFAPASLADTAQLMDRNLAAKNRLEATAALRDSAAPLAKAQREETAAYLKDEPRVRPVRILPWLVAGLVALLIAHLSMLTLWVIPALLQAAAPLPPPPPKELPRASIVWVSPEPQSMANPIEEVPTVAVAESETGLKNLTLEVSVNGDAKKSTPIPAKPYDTAGKNEVKISLYMDELGVQPFDVVSYFIRGQRVTNQKVPDTTSAIQFIQVRPFRDDVGQMAGSPGATKNLNLLLMLKLAQLKSVKENFILAHTDLAVTDPVWVQTNGGVGKNQGELSAKTEEVVQAFIQAGYPAEMVDLLRQAEPFMDDASKKILATQNVQALPPQQKALGLIIEVEKFFRKVLLDGKGASPKDENINDPFKDKQQHEMTKRFETSAGQLEQLAKNQAKLSQDLNHSDSPGSTGAAAPDNGKPSDQKAADGKPADGSTSPNGQPSAPASPGANPGDEGKPVPLPTPQTVDPFQPDQGTGTFPERQARVVQGIETLLNTNNVLPPTVISALGDAQKHAMESVHQLDQGDEADAREPAAAAAEDLQRAVTEMNQAGEQATKLAMEQAQSRLNDIARKLTGIAQKGPPGSQQPGLSDLASQVRDVRQQLQDVADQQQKAGSADGAQRLNQLANLIGRQNIAPDLDGMAKSGLDVPKALDIAQRLGSLAGVAAQGQVPVKPTPQDIANLVNSMVKSRENLARLTDKLSHPGGEMPGDHPAGQGKDQGQGQQPGAQPGQQGQQGQQPGQGQDQGKGQGQHPDGQQGQGQGKDQGQGQQPGQGQDQGKGQGQGQGQGQSQGQQANPSQGKDQAQGNGHFDNPNPTENNPMASGSSGEGDGGAEGKAYREVVADLKNELQQATVMASDVDTSKVRDQLNTLEDTHFRPTDVANVVKAYEAIAPPLDKLISELQVRLARAERDDIVKQPDLDEAPLVYRSAVSDYFESMSRDYHPDGAAKDPKKP
ncbi:MAG: hypothetical protein LV480_03675 [Methylacidiphilales bacterium]|nr:hypothetical protein [Candidatus Methylacidiphilales bacterium]